LHLGLQLSGETFGNGNIDMKFRNTTSIDGIRVFTPDGTDITSGMRFFLDDGTPLFTGAAVGTPEPGTWMLLGSGIAAILAGWRRRLRG